MILLIRTNETAGNIAVFYYGGHGFCKKSGFWRPHGVGGALCVMCCGNVFCALCAGGALVRGEIGRQPHFLWSAPDDRARGRLFNGNVCSMAVHFVSRGAEVAPNFVKIILCCWGYVTYSSRLFIA